MNESDAVRADDLAKCGPNSVEKPGLPSRRVHRAGARIIVQLSDQMREHLGIGVGAKLRVAATDKLILKGLIVFDDAIVNQRQLPARVEMRMGIFVIHTAMSRPACVANA